MSLVLTEITPVDGGQAYATLTLNNPAERNSLTAPLVAEIVASWLARTLSLADAPAA